MEEVWDVYDKDLNKIYQSLNEWKDFCHSQIAKGKLDIIA